MQYAFGGWHCLARPGLWLACALAAVPAASTAQADEMDRDPELTRFLAEIEAEKAAAAAAGMDWVEYARAAEAARSACRAACSRARCTP